MMAIMNACIYFSGMRSLLQSALSLQCYTSILLVGCLPLRPARRTVFRRFPSLASIGRCQQTLSPSACVCSKVAVRKL